MHFCPLCGDLLVPEQHQSTQLSCTACPYTHKLLTVLTSTQKQSVRALDPIFGGDDELKYASKCEAKCPKCAHGEALFLEVQTRSADEPMTIFYQCTKCRFDWKE